MTKQRKIIFIMALFFFSAFSLWNISFVFISSGVLLKEIGFQLFLIHILYACLSFIITVTIYLLTTLVSAKKMNSVILRTAVNAVFIIILLIRNLDWLTIYHGGDHIDTEFWFHAFYVDGSAFIFTIPSGVIIFISVVFVVLLNILLSQTFQIVRNSNNNKPWSSVSPGNQIVFIVALFVAISILFASTLPLQHKPGSFIYTAYPEYHFVTSLYGYCKGSNLSELPEMSVSVIDKLEKSGVRLNTVSEEFPFLKNSIYLDPKSRNVKKPVFKNRPNVIIVLVESLSQFFIDEEDLGYTGLTPTFQDIKKSGYMYTRMVEANFPTVRGIIATLGSSLYFISKSEGMDAKKGAKQVWLPILCRFSFLSDILMPYNYTSVHFQGGSGSFVGMENAFTNRQSYSKFYSLDNLEMLSFSKAGYNLGNWGLWDEDVLGFVKHQIQNERIEKPFFITISTLDLHPPFNSKHTHPNADGSPLLNSLYSTDRAVGVLWDYYKNSSLKDNTIFVIVSDHAMGTGEEYLKIRKDYLERKGMLESRYFEDKFISCVMVFPDNPDYAGKTNDILCSNLDIAPTLLDIMNIDSKNSFLGLSLFSERKEYPSLITAKNKISLPLVKKYLSEEEKKLIKTVGWNADDQKVLIQYINFLSQKRRIFPEKTVE
jgi:phosphoglycerol transferase MdoB-like AlkP superfamily enzyme